MNAFECLICNDSCVLPVTAACLTHTFCRDCLAGWIRSCHERRVPPLCPACKRSLAGTDPAQLRVNTDIERLLEITRNPPAAIVPVEQPAAVLLLRQLLDRVWLDVNHALVARQFWINNLCRQVFAHVWRIPILCATCVQLRLNWLHRYVNNTLIARILRICKLCRQAIAHLWSMSVRSATSALQRLNDFRNPRPITATPQPGNARAVFPTPLTAQTCKTPEVVRQETLRRRTVQRGTAPVEATVSRQPKPQLNRFWPVVVLLVVITVSTMGWWMVAGSRGGAGACKRVLASNPLGHRVTEYMHIAGMDAPNEVTCALKALGFITDEHAGIRALITAGAPTAIIAAMHKHAGIKNVSIKGCIALSAIADTDDGGRAVIRAGGHTAVIAAMKAHHDTYDIALYGCQSLTQLMYEPTISQLAVFNAGATAVAVSALHAYPNDADIAAHCTMVLERLTRAFNRGKIGALNEGAVPAVADALRVHRANVEVAKHCIGALSSIALITEGCQAAHDVGAAALIVSAMLVHPSDEMLVYWGCLALANLAVSPAGGVQAVIHAGAPAVIITAMRAHARSALVSEWGIGALSNIAQTLRGRSVVLAAGGRDVIEAAVERHKDSSELIMRSVGALLRLS
jgi:hypothetical protein